MVIRAIIKEDRYGNKVYVCPLCGHVFYSVKQFQRHLMKSHLYKKRRKKRIQKKIDKRGYIRRYSFGRPKVPKVVEEVGEKKVAEVKEKPVEKIEKPEKPADEEEKLISKVYEFINARAKGKKRVRFKITTLARELKIDVEKARELISKVENASMKGDRVTVKLE